jgi:hypothetical protein
MDRLRRGPLIGALVLGLAAIAGVAAAYHATGQINATAEARGYREAGRRCPGMIICSSISPPRPRCSGPSSMTAIPMEGAESPIRPTLNRDGSPLAATRR